MPRLLHVDASTRSTSFSRRCGACFADGWRAAHPCPGYVHRGLAADPVPFLDEAWAELCDEVPRRQITHPRRYREVVKTPVRRAAWAVVAPLLDELLSADVVRVATAMYKVSIPAAVGHATTYLRDFLAGHFADTDVDVVAAELVNSLVDPVLADRRPEHEASLATAEAEVDRLAAVLAPTAA